MRINRLWLSLIVLVLWVLIQSVPGFFFPRAQASLFDQVSDGLLLAPPLAVVFLLLVCWLFGWRDIGLQLPIPGFRWRTLWLPMVYMALFAFLGVAAGVPDTPVLLIVLVNVSIAAFSEELMFRGVLLQGFRSKVSIWPALLITSALFGAIHVLNVFATGEFDKALLQSFGAAFLGLMLAAILLRSGSLIVVTGVHAIWNFCITLAALAIIPQQEASGAGVPELDLGQVIFAVGFLLPVPVYSWFLLRGISRVDAV